MRIIGGEFGGRRFNPPAKNWPTRPTTDISKEGLYNMLQNRIDFEDTIMLDLFGGTGNHCYEFISRGCQDATYVDNFAGCVAFVKKTSEELGIGERIKIFKMDVFKYISSCERQYDFIFAGPPYPLITLNTIPDKIFAKGILKEGGIFVLEHNPQHNFKQHAFYKEERAYGTTIFSFFVA
ncbi:MAG: RsmD family RNA methyltransferase [Saprospiraceae bacterium]|nr:RsmD family RNA methyltransferase [Saprospiraceae bacterium]HMS70595.1 RsmD family RNA methyltransferase [Saprospiraceae bacterium]